MHETKYRCEAENSQSGGNPLVHEIQLNVEGKYMAIGPSQSNAPIPLMILYYYMRNYCNLIGLEQWYFSLIWNNYMWKLQTFCG